MIINNNKNFFPQENSRKTARFFFNNNELLLRLNFLTLFLLISPRPPFISPYLIRSAAFHLAHHKPLICSHLLSTYLFYFTRNSPLWCLFPYFFFVLKISVREANDKLFFFFFFLCTISRKNVCEKNACELHVWCLFSSSLSFILLKDFSAPGARRRVNDKRGVKDPLNFVRSGEKKIHMHFRLSLIHLCRHEVKLFS